MLDDLALPFVQRGLIEIGLLAVAAGLLGPWLVARGLAFYAHAVGTATFPGLVVAQGAGLAGPVGAFPAAVLFALGVDRLAGGRRAGAHTATALALVGALALGVVLASDVFASGAGVDTLLFGSLLLIGWDDVALAGAAAALAVIATALAGRTWLATGFDPEAARAMGQRSRAPEVLLLLLVALAITAALSAVGALLVTALFVVPAAAARLHVKRLGPWQAWTIALVAALGTGGLWLSLVTDAPPGATIAVLAGLAFLASALARAARGRGRRAAAAALAGAAVLLAGCGGEGEGGGAQGDPVKVVATTTPVADWVREVGGEDVEVTGLLQPNSDPHEYEPRPSDVRAVAGADVVFASGGEVDQWIGELVGDSGSGAMVVTLMDGIPVERRGGEHRHAEREEAREERPGGGEEPGRDEEAGEDADPHWWHDPRNAAAAVEEIARTLAETDPAGRAAFARNADRYTAEIRSLDAALRACLAAVPEERRKLVTDHDAFGYLADRYGIEVVGAVLPALTTEAQPSAGDLAELARTIRREDVRAVFPEESVNSRTAAAIARQTGASVGDRLYGDTLGPPGSPGATYLGMMRANADAMARGFTGAARRCGR